MNINSVLLIGNITQRPELKALPNGSKVCSVNVATNRTYLNQNKEKIKEVEFHNAVFFGRSAETIAQYCNKGDQLMIQGRIKTTKYEKNGVNMYKTEIVGESFQFGQKATVKDEDDVVPDIDFLKEL